MMIALNQTSDVILELFGHTPTYDILILLAGHGCHLSQYRCQRYRS